MPELPDLENYARVLNKALAGCRLSEIDALEKAKIYPDLDVAKATLKDKVLTGIHRAGKELHLDFDGVHVGIHLMRSGRIDLVRNESSPPKFARFILSFADGTRLLVSDRMAQARLTIEPQPIATPDALDEIFTEKYLRLALAEFGDRPIKLFLCDQDQVRGIGNAYADEILWAAGIAPQSKADKLPSDAVRSLYQAVGEVLSAAIQEVAKRDPRAEQGEVRDFLKIHRKDFKETADGEPILTEKISGRTAYYTAKQQAFL